MVAVVVVLLLLAVVVAVVIAWAKVAMVVAVWSILTTMMPQPGDLKEPLSPLLKPEIARALSRSSAPRARPGVQLLVLSCFR